MNEPKAEDRAGLFDGVLTEAAVFDILANERRRVCIQQLLTRSADEEISARALTDDVATELCDRGSPSTNFRQSVYVSLTQTHLPMLADHGIVEYDEEQKLVSRTSNLRLLEQFLGVTDDPSADASDVGNGVDEAGDDGATDAETETGFVPSTGSGALGGNFEGDRAVTAARGLQILASLAVVVVLVVAVWQPLSVPDELRLFLAVLHVGAIWSVLGVGTIFE